ncbi:hypothetical protein AKG30_02305 [Lacticaseibacillus paracasei]|uniref:hypothetical protein n=1 Tax=Lacticaseibacillus paracasei TaxID=1597 RepID=UPI000682C585|nr:hypothetical protein [Lacticaseibacillus paracasei]AKU33882.1 hypothetical protein AKG30_02305 [Lacticaseibacillus paracasei]
MSNETKRDVFDDALAYAPVGREYDPVNDDEAGDLRSCLSARYDAALPDDLPTILECVSKEIKDGYGKNSLLDELAWANQDALPSSKVSEWINDNETLFAEAWSRGLWIVEETGEVTGYDG